MKGAVLECRNQLADFLVVFEWLLPISHRNSFTHFPLVQKENEADQLICLTYKRIFRVVTRLLTQAGSLGRGFVRARSQARLVSRGGVSVQDTFLYRFVDLRNGHRQLRADVPGI